MKTALMRTSNKSDVFDIFEHGLYKNLLQNNLFTHAARLKNVCVFFLLFYPSYFMNKIISFYGGFE